MFCAHVGPSMYPTLRTNDLLEILRYDHQSPQVGDVVLDEAGVAQRGLIVRHLILPNRLAGSEESLTWLAREVSPTVTVSIMSQYYPANRAPRIPALATTISRK